MVHFDTSHPSGSIPSRSSAQVTESNGAADPEGREVQLLGLVSRLQRALLAEKKAREDAVQPLVDRVAELERESAQARLASELQKCNFIH